MHKNGITQCMLFCVCPFSLSVIPMRSIHASNILYWFVKFCFINGLIFLQMDIKMVSTLGLLWIKVLWKYLYISFCGPRHSFLLGICPRVEYLGYRVDIRFISIDTANSFPEWVDQFTLLSAMNEHFSSFTSSPTLRTVNIFNITHSSESIIVFTCAYNLCLPSGYWSSVLSNMLTGHLDIISSEVAL